MRLSVRSKQKRDSFEKDAKDYARNMDAHLKEIIAAVNKLETLESGEIAKIKEELVRGRKAFKYLEVEDRSKVLLTEAWANYLGGDLKRAVSISKKAYAINPASGDAYASQAIFSVLNSQPPRGAIKIRGDKTKKPISDFKYTLDYCRVIGVEKIVNKRFSQISDLFAEVQDGGEYIGILFWKLPEYDAELAAQENKDKPIDEVEEITAQRLKIEKEKKDAIKTEISALVALSEQNLSSEIISFKMINFNSEEFFESAINFAKENSAQELLVNLAAIETIYPEFEASLSGSEFKSLTESQQPIFIVVSKKNMVKYAGSARGILPKLLINTLAPGAFAPGEAKEKNSRKVKKAEKTPAMPAMPTMSVVEKKDSAKPKELSEQDKIEAQKLLEVAKMYRKSHTKLGSSKKVIKACREVIKRYPGSEYEEKAKEILRSIPEHQKKKYGVTEDEQK